MSADPDAPTIISRRRRRSLAHAIGLFSLGFAIGVAIVFSDVLDGVVHDTRVEAAAELRSMRSERAPRVDRGPRHVARAPRKQAQPKACAAAPRVDASELPIGTVDVDSLPPAAAPALLPTAAR